MANKIMLIDGNSIINRAFFALPDMSNADGEKTNAVYGFMSIFFKFLDEEQPDYAAVAFDLHKPTFRHVMYGDYKGTRKSMPDDLRPQLPLLKKLLSKMNIKIYELEGYEADDLLGTISKASVGSGLDCVIVSGDRDLLQLASDSVTVRIPKTRGGQTETETYTGLDVLERMGVSPLEYIDVKALMGDASDNIPGVPGIGEKTAFKIIQEYKSLAAALEAVENTESPPDKSRVPARAAENLRVYKEQAILSRTLATIVTDAPIAFDRQEATANGMYNADALEEIKRLGFKSMLSRFDRRIRQEATLADEKLRQYRVIDDRQAAAAFIEGLAAKRLAAFSCVFAGNACIGLVFSAEDTDGVFIEFGTADAALDESRAIELLHPLARAGVKLLSLDSKRDTVYLARNGLDISLAFDASLAAYILNPLQSSYAYNDIALEFLNEHFPSEDELYGKGRSKRSPDSRERLDYACRHSDTVYRAYPIMEKLLAERDQLALYYKIELPLAAVLKDMELAGMRVDSTGLELYGKVLEQHITLLENRVYELAGTGFNLNSPQQLSEVLFERLGLKGGKKTTQGYSTAAGELEKLRSKHEIVPLILEYRPYVKLKSTYIDGLLPVIDRETGKIYSTFNQRVTATGRISSAEPNLQNIPVRMDLGRKLRKAFIPSLEDYVFLDADYSQIELRLLAHMSGDETMIGAFAEGADIHRLTAARVLGTDPANVTPQQRNNAKAVNFGIVYGISAFSLSEDIGVTKKEADKYIAGYFAEYPKVKSYLDASIESARKLGYAVTLFGRRRPIPELKSSNFVTRSFGERVAMNTPVQGSAADIIKIAMIRVHKRLKDEGMKSRLILQVHDELLLEAHRDELEHARLILREEMENAADLSVRLEVDIHEGETWYDTK